MSDKVTVGDNDYDTEAGDKDLFHIGLAELKSNKAFLMLGPMTVQGRNTAVLSLRCW